MSKGRKTNYIQKLTNKDIDMLKAFARTGYITKDQLKEHLGVVDRRIINFERDKYIEKVSYLDKSTKDSAFVYRLTQKGQSLCYNQLNIESLYRSSSPLHDITFANHYFKIKDEVVEWITESQWRDRMEDYLIHLKTEDHDRWAEISEMWKNELISPPDGGYVNSQGVEIALEVITSNYGSEEIVAKETFVEILQAEYIEIRA